MLRPLTLLLCVLGFVSCFPNEVIKPDPPQHCIKDPPPRLDSVVDVEEGCPSQFSYCLDARNGNTLQRNVKALERYANEAWLRCGPTQTDAGIE